MTYCVTCRSNRNGGQTTVARGITTFAEAAEIALRLLKLQEELGGVDEFIAEPE